jgi:hypothetical protein
MKAGFTPEAEALWQAIPPEMQRLLLHKVWCSQCRKVTLITEFSGRLEGNGLRLTGLCATCGGPVSRLIETAHATYLKK